MKNVAIVGFLSAMLIATASSAMAADQQATSAQRDNKLEWRLARDFNGAYASVRGPAHVRATSPSTSERPVDFQAQGSN